MGFGELRREEAMRIFLCAMVALISVSARAAVLYNNFNGSPGYSTSGGSAFGNFSAGPGNDEYAEPFTVPAGQHWQIDSIQVPVIGGTTAPFTILDSASGH